MRHTLEGARADVSNKAKGGSLWLIIVNISTIYEPVGDECSENLKIHLFYIIGDYNFAIALSELLIFLWYLQKLLWI